MMHRNLDRRVEALVALSSHEDIAELVLLLDRYMDPGTASWHLDSEGAWTRHHKDAERQAARRTSNRGCLTRGPASGRQ